MKTQRHVKTMYYLTKNVEIKIRCIARSQGNKIRHTMDNLEQHRHTIATPGTLNQSKANKYNQNSQHDANHQQQRIVSA